jgi:hypothetical protein
MKRDKFERKNLGNFDIIYPPESLEYANTAASTQSTTGEVNSQGTKPNKYEEFMEVSNGLWEEFLTGRKTTKKVIEKEQQPNSGF